ncbi:MAG: ribose-5-phosphate isomerase RpiA [Gemmatimonadota bacterium]
MDADVEAAEDRKRRAGVAAAEEVRSGTTLGLGTGSTVRHFLEALAGKLSSGELEGIRGVPTSLATEARSNELGIPMVGLAEAGRLDLAIDGADEVDPQLDAVKGMGGALLREKMIAQAARRFVLIVDEGKRSQRLGTISPLPVEVVPFEWEAHLPFFEALGAEPVARTDVAGGLVYTDNGNPIMDLHFRAGITDTRKLERELRARAGVVATGLFLDRVDRVIIGSDEGVETLDRAPGSTSG